MDSATIEYVLLGTSLVLSAFFSGSEAAIVSIPVDRAKQLIEEGGRKAEAYKYLLENQSKLLTTVLIGNNIVNIFAASLSTTIAQRFYQDNGVAITVGALTFIILVFGEIIPKTFARVQAEKLGFFIISSMRLIGIFLFPFVWVLTFFITRFLGKNARLTGRTVTKTDFEYMINKAERENSMDSKQLDMMTSILEFPSIKVKDIMVPRSEVISITTDAGFDDVIHIVRANQNSRYPVINGDLDNAIGFLHVKDLAFVKGHQKKTFTVRTYLKDLFFVYEHMSIQSVFDHMNRKKAHLALVKDENSLIVGIVTLEDIMEEIFGDIYDEHDGQEELQDLNQKSQKDPKKGIVVDGKISIRDLYSDFDIKIPLSDNYSNVTGFILSELEDEFPKKGMRFKFEHYEFKLISVKNNEIRKVKIKELEPEELEELETEEASESENGERETGHLTKLSTESAS